MVHKSHVTGEEGRKNSVLHVFGSSRKVLFHDEIFNLILSKIIEELRSKLELRVTIYYLEALGGLRKRYRPC